MGETKHWVERSGGDSEGEEVVSWRATHAETVVKCAKDVSGPPRGKGASEYGEHRKSGVTLLLLLVLPLSFAL